jgi:nicotinate (nicotinamide) nucleotide adenylyltransferase
MAGRIGFLGGTFDPPHRGHVQLARMGRDRLNLERVLLAPAALQPQKQQDLPGATWQQRLAMVELAVAGEQRIKASAVDAPRESGRPNYSVDTLGRVRELFPEHEIYFLLGADAFAGLRRWSEPQRLLAQCELAVASRPGYQLPTEGNDLVEWMPEGSRFLGKEEIGTRDRGLGTREQATGNRQQGAAGESVEAGGFSPRNVGHEIQGALAPATPAEKSRCSGESETAPGVASEIGPGFSPDNQERKKDGALAPGTTGSSALVFLVGSALVRVHLLEELAEDIAASELRAQLSRGEGFDWLAPQVADYIRANNLYDIQNTMGAPFYGRVHRP